MAYRLQGLSSATLCHCVMADVINRGEPTPEALRDRGLLPYVWLSDVEFENRCRCDFLSTPSQVVETGILNMNMDSNTDRYHSKWIGDVNVFY